MTSPSSRKAARLARQCEVVERYDVRGESRASICKALQISARTFYVDRHSVLTRISHATAPSAMPAAVMSVLDARFREADQLTQAGAHELAIVRLSEIAAGAPNENLQILALANLAEALCRSNRIEAAESALREARERAKHSNGSGTCRERIALLSAEGACAFARHDPQTLEWAAAQLEEIALPHGRDSLASSRAAVACARVSYYRYVRQEIAASDAACKRSEAALAAAGDGFPAERASVLALRAEIDRYDPDRVQCASAEDAGAYALAVQHGLIGSAGVALYNTLLWTLYSDEPNGHVQRWTVTELARGARHLVTPNNGPMLTAVALGALERYDDAIDLLARCETHQDAFDWRATNRILQARLLFKARRFGEAARVAHAALQDAERSGTGLEGRALRIRAESLEALGERRRASTAIGEALEALSRHAPVHHLLAAHRCAARLSSRGAHRDTIASLERAVREESQLGSWTDLLRQPKPPVDHSGTLTRRQREIALLVLDGCTNAAIAKRLGVSRKTVANHLVAVFERLGLRARWQLTRNAIPR